MPKIFDIFNYSPMMMSADVPSDESYSGDCHQPWAQLTKHVEGEGAHYKKCHSWDHSYDGRVGNSLNIVNKIK